MSNSPQQLSLATRDFAALAADLLKRNIAVRFTARGRSMQPFIWDGDVLTAQTLNDRAPRSGEIVLFKDAGGRAIAHRALCRTGNGDVVMISDSARRGTDRIPAGALLGRIVSLERGGHIHRPSRVKGVIWFAARPFRRAIKRIRSLMRPPQNQ